MAVSAASSFQNALRRYRAGEFTDDDVTRCTGLSARSVRELIKQGAVRTSSKGRGAGRIRTFDATTFKRLAIVAAVNEARFSLRLAGQMSYLLPSDDLLYRTYDPINVLFDASETRDPACLPAPLQAPSCDWFDAEKPARSEAERDWLLEILDGRFVALVAQGGRLRLVYGDLRSDGTEFVSWWPFHAQLGAAFSSEGVTPKWAGKRQWADRIDPTFLDYTYECHDGEDDLLRMTGYAAAWRPIFKTTINMSLAIRLALRRYLGLEHGYRQPLADR